MSTQTLLAFTRDAQLASRSGYHVLADYLPECRVESLPRTDPSGGFARLRARVQRRFAFSRWCAGSSFELERQVKAARVELAHFLWCDRDLGFLDPRRQRLVGTFHQCRDGLDEAIRHTSWLPHFAAIIIMSETQRAWMESHGVKRERIHRLLHGVDTDYFKPAASPDEGFAVLAVGGTRRNFPLMRDVAASLKDEPAISFEIIGPDDKEHHFAGLPNVRYRHHVSDAELLAQYQRASCLLHLVEDSTANNVINEALACGLPVISERHGGVPEYVTNDCASLGEQGSGADAVRAIHALAGSRQRQLEMREAARAHALTLDWRIIAEQTRQLYASLS